jgi:hypothetical protein
MLPPAVGTGLGEVGGEPQRVRRCPSNAGPAWGGGRAATPAGGPREPADGSQAVMVSVWCPALVGTVTSVPRLVWRTW